MLLSLRALHEFDGEAGEVVAAQINYKHIRTFLARLPVKNERKQIVPFTLRPAQENFLRLLEKLQEQHRPPRVIVVKSRRVGISRICTGLLFAHCFLVDHADVRITAHRKETAAELYGVGALMHKRLRNEGIIRAPQPTKRELKLGYDDESSTITIGSARDEAGGRGLGFSAMLATEAAYYEQEESFLALTPTIPREPFFYVFIESTANGTEGTGGPFYESYKLAEKGQSEFTAFFAGPQEDPNCVITEPYEVKRILGEETDDENEREEKDLIQRFHLTPAQLAWRRAVLYSPECSGYLTNLHREYPYYWEQAFEGSAFKIFTAEETRFMQECVDSGPRMHVGILEARGTRPNRQIRVRDQEGPFKFWEPPKKDHWYYVGADAARGVVEGDFAAAVVWDGITGHQVAEFSARANVQVFADMLDRLGRYYGQFMPVGQAMMNIELCSNGHAVFQILRTDYGYSNFYRWLGKDDRINRQAPNRRPALCWETTSRTREFLITHFRDAIQQGMAIVRSKDLLAQARLAEQQLGQRWEVEYGHDDIIMCSMIGWIARLQWPPPAHLLAKKPAPENTSGIHLARLGADQAEGVMEMRDAGQLLAMHQKKILRPTVKQMPKPAGRAYL
jgi:hypothetical protein